MAHIAKLSLLALPLLSLTACGDVERTFGLVRDTPDEFTVETRAPLSMPPTFALRAPEPGVARPQEVSAPQAAEAALAPDTALTSAQSAPVTPGQQALDAPADIRQKVESEQALDTPSRSLTDRLMFWKSAPAPGAPLDAAAESQRLRTNAALGESPTAGDNIIQEKPKTSFLGIF
jgi:hypothetical protein